MDLALMSDKKDIVLRRTHCATLLINNCFTRMSYLLFLQKSIEYAFR